MNIMGSFMRIIGKSAWKSMIGKLNCGHPYPRHRPYLYVNAHARYVMRSCCSSSGFETNSWWDIARQSHNRHVLVSALQG